MEHQSFVCIQSMVSSLEKDKIFLLDPLMRP